MNTSNNRYNEPVRVGGPGIFLNFGNVSAATAEHQRDTHQEENMPYPRQLRSLVWLIVMNHNQLAIAIAKW